MNDKPPSASRIVRFGIFDGENERVATLTFDLDTSLLHGSGGEDIRAAAVSAVTNFGEGQGDDPDALTKVLDAAVRPLGLTARSIGDSDLTMDFQVDFPTGLTVGRSHADAGVPQLAVGIQKLIAESIERAEAKLADDVAGRIEALLGDPEAAAAALSAAHKDGSLNFRPTERLGDVACRIDVEALSDEAARNLTTLRCAILTRLGRFKDASHDAKLLLGRWTDHRPELTIEFRNIEAVAHAKAGRSESAISIWLELAYRTPGIDANQRAQILRNMAKTPAPNDPRALEWIEQSTDAYLQAGDRREAAVNYVFWGEMLEHHDALKAVKMIDGAEVVLDEPGLVAEAPSTGSGERISSSRLRNLQAGSSDTAAILQSVPGVSGFGAGGFSTLPVIRGLEAQRLTVLVDGVAIASACPNDMNPPLSYTDPQTVGAIDVITGVSPVSYGGDSIGGIIRVESAPPRFAKQGDTLLTGEISAFYRSNGDGFGGSLSMTAASDKISLTYNGSYTQADNFKGGGSLGIVRSSEYAKTDHSLSLAAQVGSGLVELKGGYHFAPYEGFPNQYMDMTSNKSWFLNGHYAGVFDWGNLDVRASWRDTDHAMNFLADKGGTATGGMPMNTEVHSAGYAVQAEILLGGAGTLRLGNEFQHQWLNDFWPPVAGNMMMGPNAFINVNGGKRDRLGTFLEWEKSWDRGFTLVAGIRNDQVWMNTGTVAPYGTGMMQMADVMAAAAFNAADRKRHDSNWSGTLLARYALSPHAEIEFGYARKVRSPNIYERYSWGRGGMASRMIGWFGDGNGYVGNLALRPEKADTLSAALSVHGGGKDGWSLKIAPYFTHVDDYIDAVKLADFTDTAGRPTAFDQLQFANQKAEIYGIDLSAAVPLWSSSSAGSARLTARASWLHGENLADHGPLYHQMPFNAALGLEHRIGGLETRIDLTVVGEKDRVDPTRNEPRTGSYALLDVQLAYRIDNVRLTLGADNLFDAAYYAPLGGMSLGDLKATGVLRPVPGRGRSVNAGVTISF